MIYVFKKIWKWIKVYWWVPLAVLLIFMAVLSSGQFSKLTEFFRDRKDLYDKERKAVERARTIEKFKKEDAEIRYNEAVEKIEKEYSERNEELSKKEKKRIKAIIKENEGQPENMSALLEDEFGLKRY